MLTIRGGRQPRSGGRSRAELLALASAALAVQLGLVGVGDLRRSMPAFLAAQLLAVAIMLLAWRRLRSDASGLGVAVGSALVLRVVAALGEPTLSDDVYRYVWDGRVQLHGLHPYAYAPADQALAELRDEDWARINHPELRTIYPPLAEGTFAALAACGAGARGFRLAFGALDFGVVLALGWLLRTRGLPPERIVLYAWNPLAILESAGSGHVEPLGVSLVVLAAAALAARRPARSAALLGAAIQAKLLPLLLVPGYLRHLRVRHVSILALVCLGLAVPYAATGPAWGDGLAAYAERWEFNALGFAAVRGALAAADSGHTLAPVVDALRAGVGERGIAWDRVYGLVWPEPLARLIVVALVAAWVVVLVRRRIVEPEREAILVLGAVLLVAPTVHPWYALWILPFAAAHASAPWLAFAALVPLAYTAEGGDVSWPVRCLEYGPVVALLCAGVARRRVARPTSHW